MIYLRVEHGRLWTTLVDELLVTDDAGACSVVVDPSLAFDAHARPMLALQRVDSPAWDRDESQEVARVDLSDVTTPGAHDLGDIVLTAFGDPSRFADLSDAQLERALARIQRHSTMLDDEIVERDAMLCEVLRRNPDWWSDALERIHDECRAVRHWMPWELAILTTKRRLRGLPDPIGVSVDAQPPIRLQRANAIPLTIRLVNVDALRQDITVTSYVPGHVRCEVVRHDGADASSLPRPQYFSWIVGAERLTPGEAGIDIDLDMARFGRFAEPGEYTLRVQYHDQLAISAMRDVSSLIVSTSDAVALFVE